jgi:alkaline phosphatase
VILLIGDGTGDSELTIGRYYLNGANGPPMAYETLPFTGEYHTWTPKYGPGPDYAPDYVPDSAPTAVAWSTGRKTGDARLSQGMGTAETVPGSNNCRSPRSGRRRRTCWECGTRRISSTR